MITTPEERNKAIDKAVASAISTMLEDLGNDCFDSKITGYWGKQNLENMRAMTDYERSLYMASELLKECLLEATYELGKQIEEPND